MTRWLKVGGGLAILAVVVERVGVGPFLEGLRSTGPVALVAALVISAVSTVCCAWRWQMVAGRLGIDLPLPGAVAACYRAQFLNATLPGGVLGDVHRAVRHGRDTGEPGRTAAAVVTERTVGQAVQVVATAAVLLSGRAPVLSALATAAVLLALLRWPGVVLTSVVAAGGHVAVFLVAARAAGTDASLAELVPLALVVLLVGAIPLNVAGWGPREGAAAWAFAAAGLGAAQGTTVAVVYGVIALVATLPGAVLLTTGGGAWHSKWRSVRTPS
jgi:glycosyltransferase 2 family protein